MKRTFLAAVVAAVVAAGLPGPALACPVCDWGTSNALGAYVATAALMSVLPLLLIAAIGLWLYRRLRTADAPRLGSAPRARDAAPIPPRPVP